MDKPESTLLSSIFNAKTITSAGGILIALVLSWTIYKILTNDLTHINASINRQADIQDKTNQILIDNAKAIEGNTKIIEIIERRLK